jgi:Helix-turn-helix domain
MPPVTNAGVRVPKPGRRPPLPARLTAAERDFCTQLRRLVDAAGLSCRALEEATSTARSGPEPASFFSKSQWGRWLNGDSLPPRRAVRGLAEVLAAEQIDASRLIDLWGRAFVPGDIPGAAPGRMHPRQLPIRAQRFVGRATELAGLAGLADQVTAGNGTVVVVLEGTAGVGKTNPGANTSNRYLVVIVPIDPQIASAQGWRDAAYERGYRGLAGLGDHAAVARGHAFGPGRGDQ